MPEALKASEVNSKTDPSVAKQYDTETSMDKQVDEFYQTVDGLKIGLLASYRPNVGPVSRSMATAKRHGPDFLYLANIHSQKFQDLENNKEVQITFQNSSNQDWVSVTGTAVVANNQDPRIKELWNKGIKAWFGDLKDGTHNGTAEDPRMALIEVKSKHVAYWKAQVGTLGFMKEVGTAALTGGVAQTGVLRELKESDLEKARSLANA